MPEPLDLTAIVVGAMGVIGAGVSWVVNRKPQEADYASKIMEATVPAYEAMSNRLAAVEKQNDECQRTNDALQGEVHALERKCEAMLAYLRTVGLDPGDIEHLKGHS